MNHIMPYHNIKNIKKQFDHIKVKDKAPFIRFTCIRNICLFTFSSFSV